MSPNEAQSGPAQRAVCLALATLTLTLALAACGGGAADEPIACTLEARPAVDLRVVDGAGLLLPGVTVNYQVDGGAVQTLVCDTVLPCALGYELAGTYAITASKAGYVPSSTTVTVGRDVCHVITERRTLTLQPAP